MNYKQLCQRVHLIIRAGKEAPGSEPSSVTGQTGLLAEIVQWVEMAHSDIVRLHHEWLFLTANGTLTIPAATSALTAAAITTQVPAWGVTQPFVGGDFGYVLMRGAPSEGETELRYIPYQEWYGHFDRLPLATGRPGNFTVTPDGDIEFDAITDREYTLRARYRKKHVAMTADASLPMLPDGTHETIVWWAIAKYYCVTRDDTREMQAKAQVELRRELTAMRNRYLPAFSLG